MEKRFSFIGEFCHNLDEKGRLALPGKLRDELNRSERPEEVVAYVDPIEGYLAFYPHEQWQLVEDAVNAIPETNQRKALARLLGFNSERLALDKAGRVLIAQKHREIASLKREVVVVGGLSKIEVWERARFDAQRAKEEAIVSETLRTVEVPL